MLTCPHCGATVFRTSELPPRAGSTLHCDSCAASLRQLRPPGAPPFRFESAPVDTSDNERQAPGDGWVWIALVRLDDCGWYGVAEAATLARAWEALRLYPAQADKLCIPSESTSPSSEAKSGATR